MTKLLYLMTLIASFGLVTACGTPRQDQAEGIDSQGAAERASTSIFRDVKIETRWLEQPVDHANPTNETFQQQILILKSADTPDTAPVFFMLGNETDSTPDKLEALYKNYGSPEDFIFIAADHRGYGQSITNDNQTVPDYVKIDQVMQDYKALIDVYREEFTGPWVGAGYSYGGSLVIDFASRYPETVDVVLSSSAVMRYDFAFSEYGEHAEELLGETIASHFKRHMSTLHPPTPYGDAWKSQSDIVAMTVGLSQIQAMQPLRSLISELAPLPTPEFLKQLDKKLPVGVKAQMDAWTERRVPQDITAETVRSGDYNWYTWKYQQCTEVGTFFIGGLFPYSIQDHIDDCVATFGSEPAYLNAKPWDLSNKLTQITDPIVVVSGGQDPWVRVGIQPNHTFTNIDFMYYPDGLHCPDRYEPEAGRDVFERLRTHLNIQD